METIKELEQQVLDFVTEVSRKYRFGLTVQKVTGNVGRDTLTVYLDRGGQEKQLTLSREDVVLAGRRWRTIQQIKEAANELAG